MSYRLLHFADLHLDRAFAGMGCQGELARRRRQGLRDALRLAGTVARDAGCAAVTIGGDLYEDERADVETARFLVETFASWKPMRVFLAPGNHDPLLPGSIYARSEWPGNVHLFREPHFEPVALADGLTLWGLAHREPAWPGDPLDMAPLDARDGVHIALFHGAELGSRPDGKSVHGPFRAEQIRQRGFAAALCGHYHRRRVDGASGLIYPGSPEPLTFDETGDRGGVIVDIGGDGRIGSEPLATNRWRALTQQCDVSGCTSMSAVIDMLGDTCTMSGDGHAPDRLMHRVDLVGAVDWSVPLDTFTLETTVRELTGTALVRVRDMTTPEHDIARVVDERSTRGAFARAALTAAEHAADADEAAVLRDALRYGLAALSGCEVGLR